MQAFDSDSNSDSGTDESEYNEEDGTPRTGKVMSIFASYYGIEDENEENNEQIDPKTAGDFIDSPNFDATLFVKVYKI